ncbi:hypothetical protein Tco_1380846 [Tanacetum coccineum]
MHNAYTIEQARCLELEAEISKLKHKIQKYDHGELIKRFSNLEVNHLNFQLECQHLKESFGNNKSRPADAPEFDLVFEINKMKASLQGKDNTIKKLKVKISQLMETRSEADRVTSSTKDSRSKPRSKTKKNRILPAKSDNKKKVKDHPRNNKSSLKKVNRVDSSISSKRAVINSNSNSVCKICNKCLISANHDLCVVKYLKFVKNVVNKVKRVWKATGKVFTNVGYQWKPTGKKITLR